MNAYWVIKENVEMITPEQVMEELQYYISEFGMDYYIEIKNGKHFPVTTAYLSQQKKKKDKLLGRGCIVKCLENTNIKSNNFIRRSTKSY